MTILIENDPWKQTLLSLASISDVIQDPPTCAAVRHPDSSVARRDRQSRRRPCAQTIRIIEWESPERVILRWCDATSGHYAEQVWKLGTARVRGSCSMSGCPIKRGDPVFRLQCRGQNIPGNSDVAILASKLDESRNL